MPLLDTLPLEAGARQWQVWGTTARILVADPDIADDAEQLVREQLDAVDLACSRFRPDSELALLPRLDDGGVDAEISPRLADLVAVALHAAALSSGDVDPTLADDLCALGYTVDYARIGEVRVPVTLSRRRRPRHDAVRLEGQRLRMPSGVHLDLGATAKARAADLAAAEILVRLGTAALVSLGGDIATAGAAPDGGWQVLVKDGPGQPATVVGLLGGGLATSSTLTRRWRHGTRLVHHILDPRSGQPAEPFWRTVTVAAADCVAANTASTAAVVAGPSAPARLHGLAARLVRRDGDVVRLGDWPEEGS